MNLVKRMLSVNYVENDPVEQLSTKILLYLILASIITVSPFIIVSFVLKIYLLGIFCTIIAVVSYVSYVLTKKNHKRIAKYLMVISLTLLFVFLAYISYGINSQIIFPILMCIVFSFYFLRFRNALIFSVIILGLLFLDIPLNISKDISMDMGEFFPVLKFSSLVATIIMLCGFFVYIINFQQNIYKKLRDELSLKLHIMQNIKEVSDGIEEESSETELKINDSLERVKTLSDISETVKKLFNAQTETKEKTKNAIQTMTKSIHKIEEEITQQSSYTEENTSTIRQYIENIEYINKITGEMNNSFIELKNIIKQGNTLINEGQQSVSKLYEIEKDLINSSAGLNDIAENINVLAINANIEAANAGIYGTGFRVVANEVRQLSVESQNNIMQMKENLEVFKGRIEEVHKKFDHMKEAFINIENHNQKTSTVVDDVHNMMVEQSQSSNQLIDSLKILTQGAESMNTSANEIVNEMDNIHKTSRKLENNIADVTNEFDNQYKYIHSLNDFLIELNEVFKKTRVNLKDLFEEISKLIN